MPQTLTQVAASLTRFPFAITLFGVRQAWNVLTRPASKQAEKALYRVTSAVSNQMAGNAPAYAILQVGDYLQSSALDLLADLLLLETDRAGELLRTAAQRALDTGRALTPGSHLQNTIVTARNTFGVVNLVNRTEALLALPPGPIDLPSAIDRAYTFPDYATLWVVEGLGREYADREWAGVNTSGLLTESAAALPEKSLLMMHAGAGIAYARRILNPLTPYDCPRHFEAALAQFAALVQSNCRPGYLGPAYESLGLVARTWFPQLVPLLDLALVDRDDEILEYFWHGVGRALYFNPVYLIPGKSAFAGARLEAPSDIAYRNAIAGASWAFALVNLRSLDTVANLLPQYLVESKYPPAISNGILSTLLMASEMVPHNILPGKVALFEPATDSDLWNDLVRSPWARARQTILPALRHRKLLGEVFRYQNLEFLADGLGGVH